MQLDLNVLINLGILGVLAFLVKGVFETRGDVRVIKSKLGLNGSPGGLVQEVTDLRKAKHDQVNQIHALTLDVELLKQSQESRS